MGKTKKVGSTGRFGPRYGVTLRKRVRNIEDKTSAPHKCPQCATPRVKRVGSGIWQCRKCNYKFAGGCWIPQTDIGKTIKKAGKPLKVNA